MSGTSSDSEDGRNITSKRVLPSWIDTKDKAKHSRKKHADDSEDNIKQVKGGSGANNAGPSETSQHMMNSSKLLDGVVFALSGFVNPERATLRSQAVEMGAVYQPDWTSDCTILVCAFTNTPKFRQVKSDGGTIISKDWISECHNKKRLVDIEPYLMHAGKPWRKHTKHLKPEEDHDNNQVEDTPKHVGRSHAKPTGSSMIKGRPSITVKDQFSTSQIKDWAINDLREAVAWLESQEDKPEKNEIKAIAAEGIITCLQDVIESLARNQDAHNVIEQWNFAPRVVREVMELENKGSKKEQHSKKELTELALRCKEVYEQEYGNIENRKMKKQKIHDKEVMENMQISSDDTGFDSDETIEMTEEEIDLAYKQFAM